MTRELFLMWTTVIMYALASGLFIIATVFQKEKLSFGALAVMFIGFIAQSLAIVVRWIATGHGPYLGFYEVVSMMAWFAILMLICIVVYRRAFHVIGVAVVPIALIMLGAAMFAPKSPLEITPTLASVWLQIHVTFAKVSYSALFLSFVLGIIYLIRERRHSDDMSGSALEEKRTLLDKLPDQPVLDTLVYRFVSAGFLLWTLMMITGAIWANEAWGRYWGWDAIETWSLITWMVYAIVLHLRLTMGYTGKRFAWCAVVAMPVMLFSLIGVPFLYNSIHSAYISGME